MNATRTVVLTALECHTCGAIYGLSENYEEDRRRDHKSWYCPNGHANYFPGESREERLKRQLDQTAQQLKHTQGELLVTKRQKAAAKGQLTKTRRRVANGVCPCCSRSFANLGRHMAGQHPEYGANDE